MAGPDGTSTTQDTSDAASSNGKHAAPLEAMKQAVAQVAELREYFEYLVSVYRDRAISSLVTALIYAALGVIGALAGAAIVTTAAVLLLIGAAHGLGAALGGRYWLGDIIVAVVILGGAAIGVLVGLKVVTGALRRQLVKKYEERQRSQRSRFGRDVTQFAGESRDTK